MLGVGQVEEGGDWGVRGEGCHGEEVVLKANNDGHGCGGGWWLKFRWGGEVGSVGRG